MRKVRIKVAPGLPRAESGMNVSSNIAPGTPFTGSPVGPGNQPTPDTNGKAPIKVNRTLQPTEKEHATLEAEKGETVVTNLGKDGIPEFYVIGGKRHSDGGTPLNLPKDSFIFSRDKKLKIKDPEILAQFGKTVGKKGKKGFTPAELSMTYNLNKYREVLANPDSDKIQIATAEQMIENYNLKLGGLAMVQESMKGFDNGIPGIAMPYLEQIGIDPQLLVQPPEMAQAQAPPQGAPGQMAPQQGPPPQQMQQGPPPQQMQQPGPPMMKFGGQPKVKFQDGGGTGLPEGAVVRQTPQGTYEVLDANGKVIGKINAPNGALPNVYDPNAGQGTNVVGGQGGGTVPSTSTRTTKSQNIPKESVKWDMEADGYDESKVQPGDYVKKTDGSWYLVDGYNTKQTAYTGDYKNETLGDLQEPFGRLKQTITENPDLQKGIITQYRTNMDGVKPGKNLTQSDIDKARAMSDEDILNNFFNMQEQVMAVNSQGITKGADWDESDSWDKSRDNYTKTVTDLGFTPLEPWQVASFQGAYIGLQNMADDPEYKESLQDFNVSQVGRSDEPGGGTGKSTISDIDGWAGNTTIGQAALYKPSQKELNMKEVAWDEQKEVKHLPPNTPMPRSDWWLQDVIKTAGAAGDFFRVKKHMPWQGTPGVHLAKPTFQDPTRQLAANAELANIATQGAATFSGPQAFNARSAQIQGKAAQNVANTLAQVHGQNVNIANQFEMANTQTLNQASDRKAQLATQLFDKNTIANQQFENSKNMARQNLRQGYIDAVTNRAMAQATNTMYPDYQVDPMSGGFLNFNPSGRPITPTNASTTGVADQAINIQSQNPGMTFDEALKYANANAGIAQSPPQGNNYVNPANFAYPNQQG